MTLSVLGARLVQLQGLDAGELAADAANQRDRSITLYAPRGSITDRNGVPLATSVSARLIAADPMEAAPRDPARDGACKGKAGSEYVACSAAALAPLLGKPAPELQRKLTVNPERPRNRYVELARGISPSAGRKIAELGLAGIGARPDSKRVYPQGALGAQLLGLTREGKGELGFERWRDEHLSGRNGELVAELDAQGRIIPSAEHHERPAVPGRDLRLTIDRDLQWRAQAAIAAQVQKSGALDGTIIVMSPKTGEILAMATAPTFDPSDPRTVKDPNASVKAVVDAYEPGSVNKVITAAAALEVGGLTPDTAFTVPDTYSAAGETFHDSESHPVQRLTLTGVIAKSSNVGTILASKSLSDQQIYDYLRKFGFGAKTGIGLPGEQAGALPKPSLWSASSRYTIPFGQGVSANALQIASVYATVANGGVRRTPRIVAAETDDSGRLVPRPAPPGQRVIQKQTAEQLSMMLEAVTGDEGTAKTLRIPGYRVAGKTGTAQRYDEETKGYSGYSSSFVGYAPADNPELVVAVVVQKPRNGYYGAAVAGPAFRDVMQFGLLSRGIAPSGTEAPDPKIFAP